MLKGNDTIPFIGTVQAKWRISSLFWRTGTSLFSAKTAQFSDWYLGSIDTHFYSATPHSELVSFLLPRYHCRVLFGGMSLISLCQVWGDDIAMLLKEFGKDISRVQTGRTVLVVADDRRTGVMNAAAYSSV